MPLRALLVDDPPVLRAAIGVLHERDPWPGIRPDEEAATGTERWLAG